MLSKFKYVSSLSLVLLLAGCQEEASKSANKASVPKVQVGVVTIQPQKIDLMTELPGRTASSLVAEIRPQVGGIVQKRHFDEGQDVNEGDLLYELDSSTYLSSYKQTQADLESSDAILKSAKLTNDRYTALRKQNNVSQSDLDSANVAYYEAVANQKKAEAAVENAKINLEHTKVRSPIYGRSGISVVTVGALVTASQSTVMTTVRALDPIYVDLAQTSLDQLKQRNLLSESDVEKGSNKVSLILEDGSKYQHDGVLKTREVSVNESTGSVTLRAEFPNPENLLLPGMFVRGKIHEVTYNSAILVPQQGVTRDVKGNPIAYVVNKDNVVEKRILQTERTIDNQWLVVSGIVAGDKVVVEGSMNIRQGTSVNVTELKFDTQTGAMVAQNAATASSSN